MDWPRRGTWRKVDVLRVVDAEGEGGADEAEVDVDATAFDSGMGGETTESRLMAGAASDGCGACTWVSLGGGGGVSDGAASLFLYVA